MEGGPEGETVQRALRIHPASESPQDDLSDAQHRWTAAQRVLRLEGKLDDLVTVLARIAAALERRAS